MSMLSELQCWDIIQCNRKYQCLLGGDDKKACWELVKDDDACSFHICVDCLVYLVKNQNSLLSEEELFTILEQRKEKGVRQYECNLVHTLQQKSRPPKVI